MRALVVADDRHVRAQHAREVERAGHEVCGTSDVATVTAQVRLGHPELLVLASGTVGGGDGVRTALQRARASAEWRLPALLLLPASSAWLHGALPHDLMPAVAIAGSAADAASIARATDGLAAMVRGSTAPDVRFGAGALHLDVADRMVSGPAGEAMLTASETAVLSILCATPEAVIPVATIARALWDQPLTDRHARAAVRSHIYTLRRKLATVGGATIETRTGLGYRLLTQPD